jgi:hypothetical protein
MTRSTLLTLAIGVALGSAGVGCGEQKVSHPPASETFVANGAKIDIGADELEHLFEEHPELDADEAIDRLVERKLLVNEALERKLHVDENLERVRKRAMVRQLLRARVEDEVTREDLSEDELTNAIEQVRREVGYPPGVRASHLVVLVPPDKQEKASKEKVEAWFEQSRDWLERLRAELPADAGVIELLDVKDAYQDKLPEPLEISVNAHLIFPVGETEEFGADLPETWHTVVPEFRDVAAKLARQGRFGELSEPVKTEFGWHVIIAEQTLPGRVGDNDAVREVARWRLLRHKRNARFAELMQEWSADAEVQIFPEVIAEAEKLND